jgi:hypothetical protein
MIGNGVDNNEMDDAGLPWNESNFVQKLLEEVTTFHVTLL